MIPGGCTMRMLFVPLPMLGLAVVLVSLPIAISAQDDTRGLVDRLDRLERDLTALQSQVYRGQSSRSGNAGGDNAPLSGNAYALLDNRIAKLEDQLRDLTGQLEKAEFIVSQLSAKLDRGLADDDFRFKQIEDKQAPPPPTADAAAGKASSTEAAPSAPPGGFLVHPGDKPQPPPPAAAKPAAEQYDEAFALLRNADYVNAERAFQAFLVQHPQDPLAGNAAFWLGQIAFAQGHFDQAAVIFLDAYQKYPKSAKAAESLLKVGQSMANLNKKKEACAALHRFQTEYPDASDTLKRQATLERQKQGC